MPKSTTDLVANIRRRAMLSQDSGQALSDNDILALASDELQNVIAPKIYAMRGWHYAVQKTYTLTGNRSYRLPNRCSAATIITIELTAAPQNRALNYVHPLQSRTTGEAYYIYANNIVLTPSVASSGTMVVKYMVTPSALYLKGNTVLGITGNNQLNFNEVPNLNLPTSPGGVFAPFASGFLDIYSALSPYELIAIDIPFTFTSTSPNCALSSVTPFADAPTYANYTVNPESIMADLGDGLHPYLVADAGFSARPMLADEHHDFLAQRTAMRCMEALGHSEDLGLMSQKLVDLESAFMKSISPRERGDFKVIMTEDISYDRRF